MLVKKYIERKLIHVWVWRDWGNETRHANDSNDGKFESFYLESVSVKPTFYNYSDGLLSQWLTYKVVSIHSNPLINLKDIYKYFGKRDSSPGKYLRCHGLI